jgi:hypothetical protein
VIYVLPFDLYKDWKELMFAKEVAKALVEELKKQHTGANDENNA